MGEIVLARCNVRLIDWSIEDRLIDRLIDWWFTFWFYSQNSVSKSCLTCTKNWHPGVILFPTQVPVSILDKKAEWTALKWLLLAGRDHDLKADKFADCLARELIAASKNEVCSFQTQSSSANKIAQCLYNDFVRSQGRVVKRKHDLHKQCEANKAYAHYRWSRWIIFLLDIFWNLCLKNCTEDIFLHRISLYVFK